MFVAWTFLSMKYLLMYIWSYRSYLHSFVLTSLDITNTDIPEKQTDSLLDRRASMKSSLEVRCCPALCKVLKVFCTCLRNQAGLQLIGYYPATHRRKVLMYITVPAVKSQLSWLDSLEGTHFLRTRLKKVHPFEVWK